MLTKANAAMPNIYHKYSTLPLLGWAAFTALCLNEEMFIIGVGSFKLSPYDLLFVGILLAKFIRLAEPSAYQLPGGKLGGILAFAGFAVLYCLFMAGNQPGIETGDVFRDLRVVFYFLLMPLLCYKDINTPHALRMMQWYLVAAGVFVALYGLGEQALGFSVSNPVRNVRLGIWVLPFSIVSLLYFRPQLGIKTRTSYALILLMLMTLAFSLNRSQYLQAIVAIGLAMLMGGRVNAMRRGIALFGPALAVGLSAFWAIGYMDVLIQRIFSVGELEYDSSYGARIQEYVGQMEFFREAPIVGKGAGFRSWVMGENGFELSTFAHNSWSFYLMKFGILGTTIIMLPCVLMIMFSLLRSYGNPTLELHRRYLLACFPVYLFVDSLSGGLAYAPKTVFIGFLLAYCLALLNNARTWPRAAPAQPAPAYTRIAHHA